MRTLLLLLLACPGDLHAALREAPPSLAAPRLPGIVAPAAVLPDVQAQAPVGPASVAAQVQDIGFAIGGVAEAAKGQDESSASAGAALEQVLVGRRDVTEEFLDLHEAVRLGKAGPLPVAAQAVSYRLVGGMLSNKIAHYFDDNMARFAKLGLDAQRVPVNTEGLRQQGMALIEKSVLESPRPVVLLAHSRGGLLVHDWYRRASPELKAKVAKVVILQSPLAGMPLIDHLLSFGWERFKYQYIAPYLYGRPLMRGFAELLPRVRVRILRRLPAWAPGDLEKFLSVRTMISAEDRDRFYEKDRALIAKLSGDNDGRVTAAAGMLEGGSDAFLRGVDHQQLVLQTSGWKRRWVDGYWPHKDLNAGDTTEALVRLLFR